MWRLEGWGVELWIYGLGIVGSRVLGFRGFKGVLGFRVKGDFPVPRYLYP